MKESQEKPEAFRFVFEPGSYGAPNRAFVPSIACLKQSSRRTEYHFVLVRPANVLTDEEEAVAQAEQDLADAFAKRDASRNDVALAEALRERGYVSVKDFNVVGG